MYLSTADLVHTVELSQPTVEKVLSNNTIFQTSMTGVVRSYQERDPDFTLNLAFDHLDRHMAIDLAQFLIDSAGKQVRLELDGEVWLGQLFNNPTDVTSTGRGPGGTEYYRESNSVRLSFKGVKQ